MKVYKCDRCGTIFPNKLNLSLGGSLVMKANMSKVPINLFTDAVVSVDLCESCIGDFILWWKEPALADITNEEKL